MILYKQMNMPLEQQLLCDQGINCTHLQLELYTTKEAALLR